MFLSLKNERDLSFSLEKQIDLSIFISTGRTFHIIINNSPKKESLKIDVRGITFCLRYSLDISFILSCNFGPQELRCVPMLRWC